MVWSDDRPWPLAMGPDLICYLGLDGTVFTNADLESIKDKEISIIGAKAQDSLRVPAIIDQYLEILHSMGYGGPYVPIEALQGVSIPKSEVIRALPRERILEPSKPRLTSWRG